MYAILSLCEQWWLTVSVGWLNGFAVENREPLMVKAKQLLRCECSCVCVSVCVHWFGGCLRVGRVLQERVWDFALEGTPCSSSQVISFRLWNLLLTVVWLIACTEVIFCRLMKKLRNSVYPPHCLFIYSYRFISSYITAPRDKWPNITHRYCPNIMKFLFPPNSKKFSHLF